MSNKYCNLFGANKIKDEYTNINTGFDAVQVDMEQNESDVATNASSISNLNSRIDNIVSQSGDDITEIVDARQSTQYDTTYTTIGGRFDNVEGVISGRNFLINSNFAVNQRAVSGIVTLAAGEYGHDRFKAGDDGCTYTFSTSENITTITITSGSLIQIIEGKSLISGTYTLSWEGTCQAQISSGGYGDSPISGTITGGVNTSVEFGTGTLIKPKVEFGAVATPYTPKAYADELKDCYRYYYKPESNIYFRAGRIGSGAIYFTCPLPDPMRVAPSVVGTIDTDYMVADINGAVQTGFAVNSISIVGNAAYVVMTKTDHGMSDSSLLLKYSSALDAEL
jgi:hypothetical protein